MDDRPQILVLGIGNLLMGDEGVGVHAVQALAQESLPPRVEVLDGGTGGFHLLDALRGPAHVIVIDATLDDAPPGTVRRLRPRYVSDYPRSLAAHDVGLRDLIESAALLGPLPDVHLITISIADMQPMSTDLSPPVAAALGEVSQQVHRTIAELIPGSPLRVSTEGRSGEG